MVEELKRVQYLDQQQVVWDIQTNFGDDFTYTNQNGNLAIDKRVLAEFRKLTEGTVVWEKGQRMWRMREEHDTPGKRQSD